MVERAGYNRVMMSSILTPTTRRRSLCLESGRISRRKNATLGRRKAVIGTGLFDGPVCPNGSVVQLVGYRSPKPMISVRVAAGLPIDRWPLAPVAQLEEQRICNPQVVGSIPGQGLQSPLTTTKGKLCIRP